MKKHLFLFLLFAALFIAKSAHGQSNVIDGKHWHTVSNNETLTLTIPAHSVITFIGANSKDNNTYIHVGNLDYIWMSTNNILYFYTFSGQLYTDESPMNVGILRNGEPSTKAGKLTVTYYTN